MIISANIAQANTSLTGTRLSGDMVIYLYDAATGHPVNGNYVTVTYTQNIDGIISTQQVSIAGQSQTVYSGTLSDDGSGDTTGFFTRFQIDSVGTVPDPAPPVNQCDLNISYVHVDDPESAPGAADAQITVSATSSYGPILYSIDNISFQPSPIFTGLTGGVKTIYVTDANDCTDTSTITISTLTSLLTGSPAVTLPGGNISRWNAVFNPIVFNYQRKDFEVTAVELDTLTGNATVSVSCDTTLIGKTIDANKQAKDNAARLNVVLTNANPVYVYISTGTYEGVYEVNAVAAAGKITINQPFVATA
ncbi:MAG: hypothetical protein ACXVJD_18550, partial [Mucilaginibacter sp.]